MKAVVLAGPGVGPGAVPIHLGADNEDYYKKKSVATTAFLAKVRHGGV